ncbi:hypothetical protein GS511_03780 [Leptospira borgpetersenii]|nr:hypothetical protein GS524_03780 [Leptospira borgpetersenii]QHE29500.1 hypothetical protein GS523_03790 [Leptospira borgpetersenii]QHE32800.1 hypothetical protein GS517_03775 [Leptospira borgpetersenii]QHE36035.1 hypothetical protein GS510_03425 [Leptospira borgpetersenii]QHE39383.1 hypothetical protein GS527_04050 [Leptospira borgpetersenii]
MSFTLRVACNEIEKERSRAPHKLSWNNKNPKRTFFQVFRQELGFLLAKSMIF